MDTTLSSLHCRQLSEFEPLHLKSTINGDVPLGDGAPQGDSLQDLACGDDTGFAFSLGNVDDTADDLFWTPPIVRYLSMGDVAPYSPSPSTPSSSPSLDNNSREASQDLSPAEETPPPRIMARKRRLTKNAQSARNYRVRRQVRMEELEKCVEQMTSQIIRLQSGIHDAEKRRDSCKTICFRKFAELKKLHDREIACLVLANGGQAKQIEILKTKVGSLSELARLSQDICNLPLKGARRSGR